MALPDAPARTESQRLAVLENDVKWIKKTTETSVEDLTGKMDLLLKSMSDFQKNIKTEIKTDLSEEFAERFVPKKALWIAIGLSGGVGIATGATFQPMIKLLLLGG